MKKNIENIVQAITKKAALPPETLRILKISNGIKGSLARDSLKTKSSNKTMPAAIKPQTVPECQVSVGALERPKTTDIRPVVAKTAPGKSSFGFLPSSPI